MTAGALIAQAAQLERRATATPSLAERLQLRGEALVCRGMAWIHQSQEMTQ